MTTFAELLSYGAHALHDHRCAANAAEQEALALCEKASSLTREQIMSAVQVDVPEAVEDAYCELIKKRIQHHPLGYLLGNAPFFGRNFLVNESTLLPRDATAVLVEKVIDYVKNASFQDSVPRFIDCGTGSGCIAISLALTFPESTVFAYDISENALEIAKKNAALLQAGNVQFTVTDSVISVAKRNDIVIANLPYIPSAMINDLSPDVRDFEPRSALDGGVDGLDLYRALLTDLSAVGPRAVFMEILPEQFETLRAFTTSLFSDARITSICNDQQVIIGIAVIFY